MGLKFAITSLTGEVTLTLAPKVRVMFNWGASSGDDSISTSIGVTDIANEVWSFEDRDSDCRRVRWTSKRNASV